MAAAKSIVLTGRNCPPFVPPIPCLLSDRTSQALASAALVASALAFLDSIFLLATLEIFHTTFTGLRILEAILENGFSGVLSVHLDVCSVTVYILPKRHIFSLSRVDINMKSYTTNKQHNTRIISHGRSWPGHSYHSQSYSCRCSRDLPHWVSRNALATRDHDRRHFGGE
jgi:hypothetical protein